MMRKTPALKVGLTLFAASAFALTSNPLSLLLLLLTWSRLHFSLFLAFAFYTQVNFANPNLAGTHTFVIKEMRPLRSHFSKTLCYFGLLDGKYPARYPLRKKDKPLETNTDYLVTNARIIETMPFNYRLAKGQWTPNKPRFNLAKLRAQAKKRVKKYIGKYYHGRPFSLISGLATSNIESPTLRAEFQRLGLSHLLALSGFHFALITGALALLLRPFLIGKSLSLLLLIFATLYFIYLGPTHSVSRAYLALIIFLIGTLLSAQPNPLNALGLALIIALLSSPISALDVGFQLSFAATIGILTLMTPIENLLTRLLPKRTLATVQSFSHSDQALHISNILLRKTLALNLSVQLPTLPLILFHFHTYPAWGLVYNLFFPPLFALSILLFLAGLIIPPLHHLNHLYTTLLLQIVSYPP